MTSSAEKGVSSDHILGFARSLLSHRVGGRQKAHEVFQTSTIVSLVEGLYDGNVPYRDVMRHGDFGVGTFNALDGEMVALDGRFFQLRSDGSVSRVSGDELTPFAAVTRFRPNIDHTEEGTLTRKQCEELIHRLAPSDNLFYALRIDGRFPSILTRTVSKQSKPYPRLADAAAAEPTVALTDTTGTIVGFHTPDYAQGISVRGYHLHFLSADQQSGGHVFDFTVDSPRIRIDSEAELHLSLQATDDFLSTRFGGDVSAEIAQAETSGPTPPDRPHVVAHVAIALNGATRGFAPDLGEFYGLAATWREDVTLTGADTILAQEPAFAAAPPGPGPDLEGPLLAVVDSRSRVTAWDALRDSGHWRDVIALRGRTPGARVDLADALARLAIDGARTVRVDSGGGLIGALLERGLIDEISLLVHPCLGDGLSWDDGRSINATFTLTHVERRDGGLVWLRYVVHSR